MAPEQIPSLIQRIWRRLVNSAVAWSWAYNGCRVAFGIILLPLVLRSFSTPDLGMYYVLGSFSALAGVLDFGFAFAVERAVSYGMSGARELRAFGVAPHNPSTQGPNFALIWQILFSVQFLYRFLALGTLLVLAIGGTLFIYHHIHETTKPLITWLAWVLTVGGATYETYSFYWLGLLRGTNQVIAVARIQVLGYTLRILLSAILLISGLGLLSFPLAWLVGSVVARQGLRRACLDFLPGTPPTRPNRQEMFALIRILWPNSWRLGCQFLSSYLTGNANALICLKVFGLAANAQYGLSIQIMTFVAAMTLVWSSVKWPIIGQYRARQDIASLRKVFWKAMWRQIITFTILAVLACTFAPDILRFIGTDQQTLPAVWLALLAVLFFCEVQFSTWGSLIVTENRTPFLRSMILTNLAGLILIFTLINFTSLRLGALVAGPLIAGCLYNYWHWPRHGAQTLKTNLLSFMLARPA